MKTETERRYATLQLKSGRRLDSHPVWLAMKHICTTTYNDRELYMGKGESDKRHDAGTLPAVIVKEICTIMTIEEMNALLRQSNSEVDESLDLLHAAYNKVRSTKELLIPDLVAMNQEIRQARMTTEREMKQTLEYLKGVREYFLEKDYEREMARLNDFVTLCKSIKALKDAGILDAVADLAIRLAVQEVAK